jgi:hypothetical protein
MLLELDPSYQWDGDSYQQEQGDPDDKPSD